MGAPEVCGSASMVGVEDPRDRRQRLRFAGTVIDRARRELWHDGVETHLEPQAFDLLDLLIDARDRVVPKQELFDRVWGDQFVSDAALTTRIKEVRRAVGDDGRTQRVIRNVRGRGYRFVAAVAADEEGESAASMEDRGLVGRAAELEAGRRALADSSVVTIVGPGGVGKSTLARELVEQHAPPDGVIALRLATLQPPDVVPALRRAAGIHSPEIDDDEAVRAIAGLDALVLLDNCEHVIVDVARLVERLAGARVRIVATSRERLGHPSEFVVRLAPLRVEPARELFRRRAAAVLGRSSSAAEWSDEGTIDRITDAVDRLPLGIEMAAGLTAALTLGELAELLESRLDVLRSPDRAVEDRQRSIASLVEWSVDPLSASHRALLSGMTAFAGGVTAGDVIGVLGGGDVGVMSDLALLVDRSLVVAATEREPTTYRLLATIRANVGPPSQSARRAHAEWFATIAERADRDLGSPGDGVEARADGRLDALAGELRTASRFGLVDEPAIAVRLTGALDRYAHTRLWAEPAMWAEQLLTDGRIDRVERAVAATAASSHAVHRGDYRRAHALAAEVVEMADEFDRFPFDPVASALESLSDIHLYAGDLGEAANHGRALVERASRRDDGYALATGIIGQMLAVAYGGRPDDALAIGDDVAIDALSISGRAWLAYGQGEAMAATDLGAAIERYEAALQLAESVSCHFIHVVVATSLLSARSRFDDPETALPAFDTVLREFRRTGCRTHAATAIRNLVDVFSRVGMDERAMVLYGLVGPSPKQTFGTELERLDAARRVAEDRAGAATVGAWIDRGAAAATGERSIDLALDVLAEAIDAGIDA